MNALSQFLNQSIQLERQRKEETIRQDPQRPACHLTAPIGTVNAPNGLCYFQDRCHIFYQWSPMGSTAGLRVWGHFSSSNWIEWEEHPPAIFPDMPSDCHGAYSGSALVEDGKLFLYYTGNVRFPNGRRMQNTNRVSSSDGIHFANKEVLLTKEDYPEGYSDHIRDPKVWKQDGMYYMLLGAATREAVGKCLLYSSLDGAEWTACNTLQTPEELGIMWESPDFFLLGNKAVLSVCPQGLETEEERHPHQSGYLLLSGNFRKEKCKLGNFTRYDEGFDFYAPQTVQDEKGRCILVGWVGVPESPWQDPSVKNGWQNCLSLRRQLTWKHGQLYQEPLEELQRLRTKTQALPLKNGLGIAPKSVRFEMDIHWKEAVPSFTIHLREDVTIRYERQALTVSLGQSGCGRTSRSISLQGALVTRLRLFSDQSVFELFVNGKVFTTKLFDSCERSMLQIEDCGGIGCLFLHDLKHLAVGPAVSLPARNVLHA